MNLSELIKQNEVKSRTHNTLPINGPLKYRRILDKICIAVINQIHELLSVIHMHMLT